MMDERGVKRKEGAEAERRRKERKRRARGGEEKKTSNSQLLEGRSLDQRTEPTVSS